MPDETPSAEPKGFPFVTALVALAGLFLFAGLVLVAYYSPHFLAGPVEPKADPVAKLQEVRAKNRAVVDGADPGVKMAVDRAAVELATAAPMAKDERHKAGRLPFPVEPKAAPADPKDKK